MIMDIFVDEHGIFGWLIVIGGAFVATVILKGVFHLLLGRLEKLAARTESHWDDIVFAGLAETKTSVIFVWIVYSLLPLLKVPENVHKAGHVVVVIASGIQICIWGMHAINKWRTSFLEKRKERDNSSIAAIGLLGTFLQLILLITVVLLGLSNLGINVGALIAGLGIGGIAVALAAQNILGDLLASLSIVLDKPFEIGDAISVGGLTGVVEHIGLKTTRVRALTGEQLIFSNKDLLESRVQNFKRMWQRRVVLKIGVTYSTPEAKLAQIPGWIKGFIEADKDLKFDRAHFMNFGPSSLDFEVVFMVKSDNYQVYMDRQQTLLLSILNKFTAEKVEFAFPTQSIIVEKVPAMAQKGPSLAAPEPTA
jgi:small-conductance mechanosensitive channel